MVWLRKNENYFLITYSYVKAGICEKPLFKCACTAAMGLEAYFMQAG